VIFWRKNHTKRTRDAEPGIKWANKQNRKSRNLATAEDHTRVFTHAALEWSQRNHRFVFEQQQRITWMRHSLPLNFERGFCPGDYARRPPRVTRGVPITICVTAPWQQVRQIAFLMRHWGIVHCLPRYNLGKAFEYAIYISAVTVFLSTAPVYFYSIRI